MVGGLAPAVAGSPTTPRARAAVRVPGAPVRRLLRVVVAGVTLFAAAAAAGATLDPGSGGLDGRLRATLGVLAAVLLVAAGALRLVQARLVEDQPALLTGWALLVLGGLGVPTGHLVTALADPGSVVAPATRLLTTTLVLALVVQSLNASTRPVRRSLGALLTGSVGAATALTVPFAALQLAAVEPMTASGVAPEVVAGALLAVAWFCVGLEATLRGPELRWAARTAPLLGAMAVAELCALIGAANPGHGYRVAAAALTAVVAAVVLWAAVVDLDRVATAAAGTRTSGPMGWDEQPTVALISGRRVGDPEVALLRSRPAAVEAGALADLAIRRPEPASDVHLGRLLLSVLAEDLDGLEVALCGCDLLVHVREPELRLALRHLLLHARDHGAGRAEVSARPTPAGVELTLTDDGPGIAPGREAVLFERGAAAPGEGGLGLHVAHTLVRRLGGELDLRRDLPGCAFRVLLRGTDPDPEAPDAGGTRAVGPEDRRRRRRDWASVAPPAACGD